MVEDAECLRQSGCGCGCGVVAMSAVAVMLSVRVSEVKGLKAMVMVAVAAVMSMVVAVVVAVVLVDAARRREFVTMLCGRAFLAMSRTFGARAGDIWWRAMRRGNGRARRIERGKGRGRRSVTRLAVWFRHSECRAPPKNGKRVQGK